MAARARGLALKVRWDDAPARIAGAPRAISNHETRTTHVPLGESTTEMVVEAGRCSDRVREA